MDLTSVLSEIARSLGPGRTGCLRLGMIAI